MSERGFFKISFGEFPASSLSFYKSITEANCKAVLSFLNNNWKIRENKFAAVMFFKSKYESQDHVIITGVLLNSTLNFSCSR